MGAGPLPSRADCWPIVILKALGAITVEDENYFGKTLRRVTALRDPDMSDFTEDELAVIEMALQRFGHETASEVERAFAPRSRLATG